MRGERILVKLSGGTVGRVVVWEDSGKTVLVTSAANYERLLRGEWEALPIGFPKSDIISDLACREGLYIIKSG